VVVFDGYGRPSNKDQEHQRRAQKLAPDIVLDADKVAHSDTNAFLANEHNKGAFVELLISALRSAGLTIHQAVDDADTLVIKVALQLATSNQVVSVIANDTDILVLLLFHYQPVMSDIYMYAHTGQQHVHSVRAITTSLEPSVLRRLLVIHAISGCDTTSCLFGHGKISVFKKLSKARDIQQFLDVMDSTTASHDEVMLAGCRILPLLYGGTVKDSLNHLRYSIYMHVTATSSQLPCPERLPPTEHAACYHLYRVHFQVLQWKLLSTVEISPQEWGWKLHEGKFIPIATDIDVAPADILKVACCKCSATTKKPCGLKACMC